MMPMIVDEMLMLLPKFAELEEFHHLVFEIAGKYKLLSDVERKVLVGYYFFNYKTSYYDFYFALNISESAFVKARRRISASFNDCCLMHVKIFDLWKQMVKTRQLQQLHDLLEIDKSWLSIE